MDSRSTSPLNRKYLILLKNKGKHCRHCSSDRRLAPPEPVREKEHLVWTDNGTPPYIFLALQECVRNTSPEC